MQSIFGRNCGYFQPSRWNISALDESIILLQVDFYLYVHNDQPVDGVYLLFAHEVPISLHRIAGESKLWHHQLSLSCDLKKEYIEYKYRIFIKGHDSRVPVIGRFLSKDDAILDEISTRKIAASEQYDVFHFPYDKGHYSECIPLSVIFYIKWLLQAVNMSTISHILQQVEGMRFTLFTAKCLREFIAWIVEQIVGPSVTDAQRLYLCVILGHLFRNCDRVAFPNDHNTKKACDRLLYCFNATAVAPFLSPSSLELLEELASTLVENSSSPGWLNLAATFYPYLGAKFVIRKRKCFNMQYKYDIKEYQTLMDTLLKNINITHEEKSVHRDLLQMVLEIAPNNEAVVELFDNPDTIQFFEDEPAKEDFFVKIFQGARYSGTARGVGAKLVELLNIPEKLRGKLYGLVKSSLSDFVRSNEELKEEHGNAFLNLLVFDQCLHESDVVGWLVEISRSKSVPRHKLLLMILNNWLFRDDWHNTTMARKVKICSTWVTTKVANEMCTNSGIDKTTAVYHGIEELMCCSLNKSNTKLAEEVSQTVTQNILKNEESLSVLKAFVNIEKYSIVVQDCYKTHVKEILVRDRRLIKKSLKVLEDHSSSG